MRITDVRGMEHEVKPGSNFELDILYEDGGRKSKYEFSNNLDQTVSCIKLQNHTASDGPDMQLYGNPGNRHPSNSSDLAKFAFAVNKLAINEYVWFRNVPGTYTEADNDDIENESDVFMFGTVQYLGKLLTARYTSDKNSTPLLIGENPSNSKRKPKPKPKAKPVDEPKIEQPFELPVIPASGRFTKEQFEEFKRVHLDRY